MPTRRKRDPLTRSITIRVQPDVMAALEDLAQREERLVSDVARRALRAGLELVAPPKAKRGRSR